MIERGQPGQDRAGTIASTKILFAQDYLTLATPSLSFPAFFAESNPLQSPNSQAFFKSMHIFPHGRNLLRLLGERKSSKEQQERNLKDNAVMVCFESFLQPIFQISGPLLFRAAVFLQAWKRDAEKYEEANALMILNFSSLRHLLTQVLVPCLNWIQ